MTSKLSPRRIAIVAATGAITTAAVPATASANQPEPQAVLPATIEVLDAFLRGDVQRREEAQVAGRLALLGTLESDSVVGGLVNALRGVLRGDSVEAAQALHAGLDYLGPGARETVLTALGDALNAAARGDRAAVGEALNRALNALTGTTGTPEPNSVVGGLVELVDQLIGHSSQDFDSLDDLLQALLQYDLVGGVAPGGFPQQGKLVVRSSNLRLKSGSKHAKITVACIGGPCSGRVLLTRPAGAVEHQVGSSRQMTVAANKRHTTKIRIDRVTRMALEDGSVRLRASAITATSVTRKRIVLR